MKLSENRRSGGLSLLMAILSGWFFLAGFEKAWSISHIMSLVILITAVPLTVYYYGRDFFHFGDCLTLIGRTNRTTTLRPASPS